MSQGPEFAGAVYLLPMNQFAARRPDDNCVQDKVASQPASDAAGWATANGQPLMLPTLAGFVLRQKQKPEKRARHFRCGAVVLLVSTFRPVFAERRPFAMGACGGVGALSVATVAGGSCHRPCSRQKGCEVPQVASNIAVHSRSVAQEPRGSVLESRSDVNAFRLPWQPRVARRKGGGACSRRARSLAACVQTRRAAADGWLSRSLRLQRSGSGSAFGSG